MGSGNENALVQFGNVSVNSIGNASGVFVGTNTQFGWSSHEKENAAHGLIFGDLNIMNNNLNLLYDNDIIDSPINDADLAFNRK